MEQWKQEVVSLRQQGEEEKARHMNMIGEAVHAVHVEAMGNEGIEGMKQRLESISKSVEQGKASMEAKVIEMEKEIKALRDLIPEK